LSEAAKDLISKILERDPDRRLSIEEILKHPWMSINDEKVHLFFDQERDYIKHAFTYNDTSRINRNEKVNISDYSILNESEIFPEHMLDTNQELLLVKNNTTKSIILAPFNSTISHLDPNPYFSSESLEDLLYTKSRVLKLQGRVKEVDRQYELNNNADLDNGIYHKLAAANKDVQKSPSPEQDERFAKLESLIN
jgi:serine/threonine protein kinase